MFPSSSSCLSRLLGDRLISEQAEALRSAQETIKHYAGLVAELKKKEAKVGRADIHLSNLHTKLANKFAPRALTEHVRIHTRWVLHSHAMHVHTPSLKAERADGSVTSPSQRPMSMGVGAKT